MTLATPTGYSANYVTPPGRGQGASHVQVAHRPPPSAEACGGSSRLPESGGSLLARRNVRATIPCREANSRRIFGHCGTTDTTHSHSCLGHLASEPSSAAVRERADRRKCETGQRQSRYALALCDAITDARPQSVAAVRVVSNCGGDAVASTLRSSSGGARAARYGAANAGPRLRRGSRGRRLHSAGGSTVRHRDRGCRDGALRRVDRMRVGALVWHVADRPAPSRDVPYVRGRAITASGHRVRPLPPEVCSAKETVGPTTYGGLCETHHRSCAQRRAAAGRQRLHAVRRPADRDRRPRGPHPARRSRRRACSGATGTGKSATTAWLVERLQRPTLVMAPNKTLAAQLANELREMLPNNAVEYFVSYYDYYQPEAYIPQTDTYIEKDSSINDEVERLRHSATNSLLTRRDVVVVASVSCIYGLGTPQEYVDRMVRLKVGQTIERDKLLRKLVEIQYTRNDVAFTRGTFRVRGDTIEIIPRVRRARRAHRDVRRRDRAAVDAAPVDRRDRHRRHRALRVSRPRTTSPVQSGWSARSPASRPSSSSGWPSSRSKASCSSRSGCACARRTTSR